MFNISKELLKVNDSVLLLGSDAPQLSEEFVEQAISGLAHKDIVVGPATDGGYYILGLKYPHAELFTNIDWGSDLVFAQTVDAINTLALEAQVLERQNDLDTWEDLKGFYQEAQIKPELQKLTIWPLLTKFMTRPLR